MRLDKYLANSGVGSRSEVKAFIKSKLVKVNGEITKSESMNVEPGKDIVLFRDLEVVYKEFYYFLLNKPTGYVSAVIDNVYPPVTDLLPEYSFVNLFPVGRLDVDTTGVLLLTNDGDLAHKLIAPKYRVDKKYAVKVDDILKNSLIDAFKNGIELDGEKTLPGDLVILDEYNCELAIHQGKFHQVKRMFKHFGYNVTKLDRKEFAFLNHEGLELGEYRELSEKEVVELKKLVK